MGVRAECLRGPAALGLLALLWPALGCGSGSERALAEAEAEPEWFAVGRVERARLPETVRLSGSLAPDERVALAAQVAGRVLLVSVDLGDELEPGALVVRLDLSNYALAVAERRLALDQALAGLGLEVAANGELPEIGPDLDLEALPAVRRAQLEATSARARYERARALGEARTQVMSEQALEDLRAAWDVSESALAVERLAARAALAGVRTLEAQWASARWRLEQTRVRAPAAPEGVQRRFLVAERLVAAGDYVQAGDVLLRLVDSDPVKLRAAAPERFAGRLRVGQEAELRVQAQPRPFGATVTRIAPSVDEATRTFQVELTAANPEGLLKPGAFASAEVRVGTRDALLVPAGALARFAGVERVFGVEAGRAVERRVRSGALHGELIEVAGPLEEGEAVLLSPSGRIAHGSAVRIRTAPQAGALEGDLQERTRTP